MTRWVGWSGSVVVEELWGYGVRTYGGDFAERSPETHRIDVRLYLCTHVRIYVYVSM